MLRIGVLRKWIASALTVGASSRSENLPATCKSGRPRSLRKGAVLGGAALGLGLITPPGALADCKNDFDLAGFKFDAAALQPFGQGGGVNSLVSVINTVNTAFLTHTSAFVSAPGNPRPGEEGSGVWARAIGGTVETQATGVTIVPSIGNGLPGGPFPITGSGTCNTTTRQDFTGYQFGYDIAKLNIGGANWHFGVTAGYLEANAKDISSPLPDPSFSGNFQVPFAGVYMTLTKGGFFADAQARWEFYQNRVSDAQNFLLGQKFDARGFSLTGNVGYNQPLGSGWFIEPSAGVVWSRVKVDPLNVAGPGPLVDPFFFPFPLAGTVQMDDVESLLGRASLRIGANIAQGNITWQPFFTASVFHEFAGDVTTTLTPGPAPLFNPLGLAPATLTTTRVGTYAQFGLGTAAVFGDTGWLGYGRVDYRTGENVEGMSVSAGLRYQFMPVQSGDTVKYGQGQITSHTYDWTGPYIGAFAGMTWGDQSQFTHFTPAFDTHDDLRFAGYLAGGQVGYNVQIGRWVLGIEGDYGLTNATGAKSCVGGSDVFLFTCEGQVAHRLASLTGRLGYTWGRALLYAKGGVAAGAVTVQVSDNTGGFFFFPDPPISGTTKWLTGWTVGGGIEFALTDRWSAKAEYMHYDLGADNFPLDVVAAVVDARTRGDTVRIGVNYHFQK